MDLEALVGRGGSFNQAVTRAHHAPDVAAAFYEGYHAALHALDPELGIDEIASFCVTEAGGGHPRALLCRLSASGTSLFVDGEKTFVTGFDRATVLLVAAREGEREDGTPRLAIVRVPVDSPGIEHTFLPDLPFAPTMRHAKVRFTGVELPLAARLPGDGYADYVKPFRTVEDVHVVGALAAFLLALALERDARGEAERLLAILVGLSPIAARSRVPEAQLALAGLLSAMREVVTALLPRLEDRADVVRDVALLRVAEKARESRRGAAWERVRNA